MHTALLLYRDSAETEAEDYLQTVSLCVLLICYKRSCSFRWKRLPRQTLQTFGKTFSKLRDDPRYFPATETRNDPPFLASDWLWHHIQDHRLARWVLVANQQQVRGESVLRSVVEKGSAGDTSHFLKPLSYWQDRVPVRRGHCRKVTNQKWRLNNHCILKTSRKHMVLTPRPPLILPFTVWS